MDYLTTRTSLSPIRRGFTPCLVNYKKRCTRPAAASDKVYQLLAHGWWFSPGPLAFSTTKSGRHDIAEILLKVALNTINQIKIKIIFGKKKLDDIKGIIRITNFRGQTIQWRKEKGQKIIYIILLYSFHKLFFNPHLK